VRYLLRLDTERLAHLREKARVFRMALAETGSVAQPAKTISVAMERIFMSLVSLGLS
jgi:hypothetical protein